MTEIKPCPFCGEQPEIGDPFVVHPENGCILAGYEFGDWHEPSEEAIAAWNQRVPDPSVITGLREAREALAALLATVGEPVEIKARPTIAELEAILASESSAIEILPSGEIRCCPSEACGKARATLAHLDTLLANQEDG